MGKNPFSVSDKTMDLFDFSDGKVYNEEGFGQKQTDVLIASPVNRKRSKFSILSPKRHQTKESFGDES